MIDYMDAPRNASGMTVGVGFYVDHAYILAADSRVSIGTRKGRNQTKIHHLGSLVCIAAGDLGQVHHVLRTGSEPGSADGMATLLEECRAVETEWLVLDPSGLYTLTPGEGGVFGAYPVGRQEWGLIGSGWEYMSGYLDAYQYPDTRDAGLNLCKTAMQACAKRYMCVGGPFKTVVIPC